MNEAESSMDRLCDTVNEVLRTNQDLSLRLRNIENASMNQPLTAQDAIGGVVASKTETGAEPTADRLNEDDAASTTSKSSSGNRAASITSLQDDSRPRPSYFEEILHRSRVYRHTSASHSQSSLISDARSTLALSVCSSVTLGEISNIAVFAIPVYATELSNADCYDFELGAKPQAVNANISTSDDKSSRAVPSTSQKRDLRMWWRQFRQSKSATAVSEPRPIFGVPLETSIRYANVAISLTNEDGQSFIYGYIPIVVAKCSVFLKEKGMCFNVLSSCFSYGVLSTLFFKFGDIWLLRFFSSLNLLLASSLDH